MKKEKSISIPAKPLYDRTVQLNTEVLKCISKSREDVEKGRVITHDLLRKEVRIWLKSR
ncbi:MAG TPA: hypothetical protein VK213_13735 [Bacteroidales bacterium]|nr:hypothetical protein [Bacteroidales bacterium]